MSDEPKKRLWSRAWIWWAALAMFVLYPISAFPLCIACAYLQSWGVIAENGTTMKLFETCYAPVGWVVDNSPVAERAFRFVERPFDVVPAPPKAPHK